MRKNIGTLILSCAIFLFLGIMFGLFIGHGTDGNAITLTPAEFTVIDGPSPTTAYRDEVLGRVNINTANVEELTSVPGIGQTTAQRIVEYRRKYGKFYSVSDLLNVKGIGESTLEDIRSFITVGG